MSDKLKQIQQSKLEAEQKTAALRNERESLPEQIKQLKAALIRDSSIDPQKTLAEINEKTQRLAVVETLAVHAEADRIRAEIDLARFPIPSLERDMEAATNARQQADDARQAAQRNYEAAEQAERKLVHDIEDARRRTQKFEADLSRHFQESRTKLAA